MKSNRENRFFSWITALSIAGIAIGVAAMIVVLSLINGFERELRNRFLHANAHVMVYKYPGGMMAPQKWAKLILKDFPSEISGISPFVHYETMVRRGALMHAALVRGIIPKAREAVQSAKDLVRPASALDALQKEVDDHRARKKPPGIPAIIVGSGLLSLLEAKIGDEIELVDPTTDKFGELRKFKVVGVYDSGLKHYDNKLLIMSVPSAQSFFRMGNIVTGLEIGLKNPDASREIAQRMNEKYALYITEWQSFNRPLFEAMQMERAVIALIVALVAFVAGFNILTTLFVSVSQKQRDISILKALGASNGQVVMLFIQQGVYIGIIGASIGLALAFVVSAAIEKYQFVKLPDLYLLASLPMTYDWRLYLGVASSGLVLCLLAGIYPALIAARVMPTEGFRGARRAE